MPACKIPRMLRTCGQPSVAVCQYCGRAFCESHGDRLEDGQEICTRSTCQRKKAELAEHLRFKQNVASRNREQLCGLEQCDAPAAGQCSKCRGLFCRRHLATMEIEERRGSEVTRRLASACHHCRRRRRLWSKT